MPVIEWLDENSKPNVKYRPHKYPEHLIKCDQELKEGLNVLAMYQNKAYPARIISLSDKFSLNDNVYQVQTILSHGTYEQWNFCKHQLPKATQQSLKMLMKKPHGKQDLLFLVRWAAPYTSKDDTLEPQENLEDATGFDDYIQKHPELRQHLSGWELIDD